MKLINSIKRFWYEEDGVGTLEIIMILAVILMIAIVFRKWIIDWFNNLINTSNNELKKTSTDSVIAPDAPDVPQQ